MIMNSLRTPTSKKKKKSPALLLQSGVCSVSKVMLVLGCCCVISLLISFLNGSALMMQQQQEHHDHNHDSSSSSSLSHNNMPQPVVKKPLDLDALDKALFGSSLVAARRHETNATATSQKKTTTTINNKKKNVGQLTCQEYGGPMEWEATQEMVYWQDISEDETYESSFYDPEQPKFLTFEPDRGGFNNIRMAMETVLAMAVAMGRILVLPPDQPMYLLNKVAPSSSSSNSAGSARYTRAFGFQDFFPMQAMAHHVKGLHIITMENFLQQQGLTGQLKSVKTGQVLFPPDHNRTNWDGRPDIATQLEPYLRQVGFAPANWGDPQECMAAFPDRPKDDETMTNLFHEIVNNGAGGFPPYEQYIGHPTPVHASTKERWMEQQNSQRGSRLCLYTTELQSQHVLHFAGKKGTAGGRLLTHFYTFLFFQNWQTDLWMKRFVRDHVRYQNDIQCAAARIVQAIRRRVQQRTQAPSASATDSPFDAFHVRRGDFQYKKTRVTAQQLYEISKEEIPKGATVYIATDEVRQKSFFDPLKQHYDILFLDDFRPELHGMNPNFFGMLDQLVAARSRTFFGCWFSTFTGYINRLRGYDSDWHQLPGFEQGILDSYYYATADKKYRMREYWPISGAHYAREFPIAWRNIDHGIGMAGGSGGGGATTAAMGGRIENKTNENEMKLKQKRSSTANSSQKIAYLSLHRMKSNLEIIKLTTGREEQERKGTLYEYIQ
ncbi:hypothetical protein ACA910_015036 [Epithemia clementina (nom. ined.)]